MNNVCTQISQCIDAILGWPLVFYVTIISVLCTIMFGFVQFRYFVRAWKEIIMPDREVKPGDMTPFQAFVSTLSSNLGNGSIAGVATAIFNGGPGAAFWMLVFGLILMSVRFAEVYLAIYYGSHTKAKGLLGGPMLYMKEVVGGSIITFVYTIAAFLFGLTSGSATQTNSIALSLQTTWNIPTLVTAFALTFFILYVIFGGSQRVASLSEKIVSIKVIVFFVSSFIILGYHYRGILDALSLIFTSAFHTTPVVGGILGFTVQQAMRYGMSRITLASESGLGTAAILFGSTGSTEPVKDSLMAMISTFVSTLVSFIVALCIVVSGVWNSGLNSTALTIASFNTVFGSFGGWIVSFLSITFGVGVLVSYVYIARVVWLSLTNGRYASLFTVIFLGAVFSGAIVDVPLVWYAAEVTCGIMLFLNLFAIAYLIPTITKGLRSFAKKS
jgi:AGCS family alanine or glycine:cation symporter